MDLQKRSEKVSELYGKVLEALDTDDFYTAKSCLEELESVAGADATTKFLLEKCNAAEKYATEGSFYTTDLEEAIAAFIQETKDVWTGIDEEQKKENENFVNGRAESLMLHLFDWMLDLFHQTVSRWGLDGAGIQAQVETSFFCKSLIELYFFAGDKIEELSALDDRVSIFFDLFWRRGCKMIEVLDENPLATMLRSDHELRVRYTNKIRKLDPEYPEYSIPIKELTLEERLEKSKKEKYLYSMKGYSGKEFVVPPEIECIGHYAFYRNKTLRTVIIHKNVTEIGDSAFADTYIDKVVIERGSKLKRIYARAFEHSYVSKIKIPPECEIDPTSFHKACKITRKSLSDILLDLVDKVKGKIRKK